MGDGADEDGADQTLVQALEEGSDGGAEIVLGPIEFAIADRQAALEAVRSNGLSLKFVTAELQADREVVSAALERTGALVLEHAAPELLADREVMREAAARDAAALRWADAALQDDPDFVGPIVERSWWAMQYAGEALRSDRAWVLRACRRDGRYLQWASAELRGDSDVVMASIRRYGLALRHASEEIRADYEIVMAAVKSNGLALQFADPQLRDDREVVMEAVLQNSKSFRYASYRLHKDQDILAAQGFAPGEFTKSKNGQAPPPELLHSAGGYVEYRRPRVWCWPVVYCCSRAGSLRPRSIPDRTEGCLAPYPEMDTLVEEVWNESGKERLAAAPLIWSKLDPCKMDAASPRDRCCTGGSAEALEAWDAYHGWVSEALQRSVERFGFALLVDLHGQSHRRMVTELGYLVDVDELLLFDAVLDKSTRPTTVDMLFRGPVEPPAGRPGGASAMLRGPRSLGGLLEGRGFRCTPSPAAPEPVEAIPLYRAREKAATAELSAEEAAAVTFLHEGYTVRRYGAPASLAEEDGPLSDQEQQSWGGRVAAVQVYTSWLGVRHGLMERRSFGESLAWAAEELLTSWVGWAMPPDTRG